MMSVLEQLLGLLDLETIEDNIFRGHSPVEPVQRVFGGQVLAQALVAATRTVDARRPCHSFHAYFLRPGDPGTPILYEVDRSRDGASFSARRVVAVQHGAPIFTLASSFQRVEQGFEHQAHDPRERVDRELVQRRDVLEPGVVHEDVDAAHPVREPGGGVEIGEVHRQRQPAEAVGGGARGGLVEVRDDDLGPGRGQALGAGQADAAGGAGDQGGAAGEVQGGRRRRGRWDGGGHGRSR